jgi:hypothetical protein
VTPNRPAAARPEASAGAAAHLAELDAQHDAHLAALRERAVRARADARDDADLLAERVEPDHQDL